MRRAVFLDRDGTIDYGIPTYERVDSVDKVQLLPSVLEALALLAGMDYLVFVVTNQAGIAEGLITPEQFEEINNEMLRQISPSGITIQKTYMCPHGDKSTCKCRKPQPKMLLDAAREFDVDLAGSWMIGDRPSDVMAGVNAGTRAILVQSGVADILALEAEYTADTLLDAIRYIADQNQ